MQPESGFQIAPNWKNEIGVTICWHDVTVKFFWCCFVSLVMFSCRKSMSVSSLVLELWQFSSIRDWPEIRKSEIPPSEICPIFGDWEKLGLPNLAQMFLMKCYWMLQNSRVTAFVVSEFLKLPPSSRPPRLGIIMKHQ